MLRKLLVGMALLSGVLACSSEDEGKKEPTCPAENPECKEISTVESGLEAIGKRKCRNCHGEDLGGSSTPLPDFKENQLGEAIELYPPNLTPDPTGTAPPDQGGKWTDDALALAIRQGIDKESMHLCPQMKHDSTMSDFEVYSIVKYLRSIPPVKRQVPRSVCPPLKTKDQQSEPRN